MIDVVSKVVEGKYPERFTIKKVVSVESIGYRLASKGKTDVA